MVHNRTARLETAIYIHSSGASAAAASLTLIPHYEKERPPLSPPFEGAAGSPRSGTAEAARRALTVEATPRGCHSVLQQLCVNCYPHVLCVIRVHEFASHLHGCRKEFCLKNANSALLFFFYCIYTESAHSRCNLIAYIVKTDINNGCNITWGPHRKTLITLKVDRYYRLFYWKRGFTMHFGF